jgi:hypothetical protein
LEKGDYAAALREFLPLANQGSVEAQFNLDVMYDGGRGVPQGSKEPMEWYRLAADQGHSWYQLAAAQGNPKAQYTLGVMYANGHGVPQDHNQAMKLYLLAADQGESAAQLNLGSMYGEGEGAQWPLCPTETRKGGLCAL